MRASVCREQGIMWEIDSKWVARFHGCNKVLIGEKTSYLSIEPIILNFVFLSYKEYLSHAYKRVW